MTMRTYRYFVCPNGHSGQEVTSENDQPYSDQWESTRTSGLVQSGKDALGYAAYQCQTCSEPMAETKPARA
jgi:hypothetical protein